jgi:hypothetical protein
MSAAYGPELRVNHRYGGVFLHLSRRSRLGRVSTVARLSPAEADELADALRDCATRARKEPRRPATLKLTGD